MIFTTCGDKLYGSRQKVAVIWSSYVNKKKFLEYSFYTSLLTKFEVNSFFYSLEQMFNALGTSVVFRLKEVEQIYIAVMRVFSSQT